MVSVCDPFAAMVGALIVSDGDADDDAAADDERRECLIHDIMISSAIEIRNPGIAICMKLGTIVGNGNAPNDVMSGTSANNVSFARYGGYVGYTNRATRSSNDAIAAAAFWSRAIWVYQSSIITIINNQRPNRCRKGRGIDCCHNERIEQEHRRLFVCRPNRRKSVWPRYNTILWGLVDEVEDDARTTMNIDTRYCDDV